MAFTTPSKVCAPPALRACLPPHLYSPTGLQLTWGATSVQPLGPCPGHFLQQACPSYLLPASCLSIRPFSALGSGSEHPARVESFLSPSCDGWALLARRPSGVCSERQTADSNEPATTVPVGRGLFNFYCFSAGQWSPGRDAPGEAAGGAGASFRTLWNHDLTGQVGAPQKTLPQPLLPWPPQGACQDPCQLQVGAAAQHGWDAGWQVCHL